MALLRGRWAEAAVGLVVVVLAVLRLRLLLLHRPPSVDEAGYLAVARQWRGAGPEVYSRYFLDRPPLLVGLYRLAADWGGVTGLLVIGLVAAVVATAATAVVAGRVAGRVPAVVAAVLTAALLASPATDAPEVNGELLAAPFVAVSILLGIAAVTARTTSGRRGLLIATAAGMTGAAAVLVKQNMFDGLVFLVVLAALGAREAGGRRTLALLGAAAGGAVLAVTAVLGWAWHRGSSPREVVFATYGFRLKASSVLAHRSGYEQHADALVRAFLVSGLAIGVVVAVLAAWPARRRRDLANAVVLASGVTLAYGAVSVLSGQQYWTHYLIQLVVPLSTAIAVASVRLARSTALVAAFAVVSCVVSTVTLPAVSVPVVQDHRVGQAIGKVSRADDTIVAFPGHGDLTYASGLLSPYPYLWRLQSETLDPRLHQLDGLLRSPTAPTWFVDFSNLGLDVVQRDRLHAALAVDYQRVGKYGDGQVYLHDGVHRAQPTGRA